MVEKREYERWRDLNVAGLRAFFSKVTETASNGRLIERDGLIATVSPDTPKASLFNSVVYWQPNAVAAAVDELADEYEEAGVQAWTVWVPNRDRAAADLLAGAGHKLDADPRMMGRELSDLEPHEMGDIDWTAEGDPAAVCELNDAAYTLPPGTGKRGFGLLSPDSVDIYVANVDGEPAACVVTIDVGEDLGIYAVATRPEAQGRGLSTALMRQAMADARDRGLKTTSLQASKAGQPVYERVGYGDFGCFEMWERREPKPEG